MMAESERRWWRRIQWTDVVLVVMAVIILLFLTAELWLPHFGPSRNRRRQHAVFKSLADATRIEAKSTGHQSA